jgi:lipopolysaccharide export system permease protein
VKTDRIWYRSRDAIFNIKTLNPKEKKAQGLTLYYFNDKWDLIQMITAKEVELLGANWDLLEGSVTIFTEDSSFPMTSNFKKKTIVMGEEAKDLANTGHTSDVLTLDELSEFIKKNKEAGLDTVRYEVDYHSKFGYAISGLIMVLLGIPFCVTRARSGSLMMNASVVLGLVFLYYIFFSSALALGNYGQIPPIVAGWAPNLIMGGLAIAAIRRLKV